MLDNKGSFSSIATQLEKDPTTISKEVRNHLQYKKTGAYRRSYNSCSKRIACQKSHICTECHVVRRYSLCRRCSMCNAFCKDFEKETCKRLLKPPYVCNGCGNAPNAAWKSGSITLTLPTGNIGMFFRNPGPVFPIPKMRSVILMNSFLL